MCIKLRSICGNGVRKITTNNFKSLNCNFVRGKSSYNGNRVVHKINSVGFLQLLSIFEAGLFTAVSVCRYVGLR